jgi:lipopolysaccharide export system protein LptA
MKRRASLALVSVLTGLAFCQLPVVAQTVDTTQSAKNAKTPQNVDIESDSMEILDKEHKAVFKGNVNAVRSDVTLKCDTLVVTYTETPVAPAAPTAKKDSAAQSVADNSAQSTPDTSASTDGTAPAQGGDKKTEVTFLDADGNVIIITSKQTINGKTAHMDVKANKLWVKGGTKVVQGKTVMNGDQLFVDLKTNKSEMTGGRVKGSFVPGQ